MKKKITLKNIIEIINQNQKALAEAILTHQHNKEGQTTINLKPLIEQNLTLQLLENEHLDEAFKRVE